MAIKRSGVEQARKNLSALLERANRGSPSLVTKHGRVYAAIVRVHYVQQQRKHGPNVLALRGTGKGLWETSVKRAIRQLRSKWN